MAFEFEALVGNLYIVGGRTINTSPPGVVVEVAPRKAARGREIDTFLVLVMPSGEETAPSAFYEQMAALATERYFDTTGSVTAALRAALHTLNEKLYEHNTNEKRRYEANIICAVLRGAEVYVARVGAAMALYRHERTLVTFPEGVEDDEVLFGMPLGVQPAPTIKMANYRVSAGSRLLLADAHLADLEMTQLAATLDASDLAAILSTIRGFMPLQMTLVAAEFVPPEVPATVPVRSTSSSRALPAALPPAGAASAGAESMEPVASAPPARVRARELPLPLQEAASTGARTLARGAEQTLKIIDRVMPPPLQGSKSRLATPAATGAAILIPVIVVMIVVVMWITGTGASEFDLCLQRAAEGVEIARGIPSQDVAGTINAWNAVSAVATECQRLRPNTPNQALTAITTEAQMIIDRLMVVTRRETAVVASFPQAGLTRGVLQGQDLYVLDDGNDQVYRVTLNADGMSMVPNTRQALAFMRRNVRLNEYQVGDLIDITWAVDGSGLSQNNVLVALDSSGLLIDCAPRFSDTCGAQRLPLTENWINPVGIAMWSGRVYVLDPGANQVWRYDPNAGAFANAPIEYFSGEGRPDIRLAVDFAIDTEGVVYILLATGNILKFRGGSSLDFAFAGFPQGQSINSANAFFLNTNPLLPGLYIANRETRTVYETLLGGTFVHSFRAQTETYFDSLADVIFNNDQKLIYALSGNSVFAFRRDD
jgi:hypothetical protein